MATWVLTNESCNINYKRNGVSHRTLPKELTVLEVVLAGEALNDTSVDNVFVRYEGKYAIELPYNDTTIGATGYGSAELLRAAILALLNSNPCAGGGSGGGDILSDGSVNFIADETWDDGGAETTTVGTDGVVITDGALSIVSGISYGGFQVGAGPDISSMVHTGVSITDGTDSSGLTSTKLTTKAVDLGIRNIQTADSPYLVTEDDYTIICNCDAGAIVIDLTNVEFEGNIFNIKKIDANVDIVEVGSGVGDIDGINPYPLVSQYESITIQFDGANWWII